MTKQDLFWQLLEPEHPKAEAFSRRLAGEREAGDDLYQEALLAALQKFDTLREHAAFKPWLYRIIVNQFKNRRRGTGWRRFVPLSQEIAEEFPGWDPRDDHDSRRLLQRAFAAVTPEEKALVTLFEIEGWSVSELASLHQAPEGTIKARLSRARSKMRKALLPSVKKGKAFMKENERSNEAQLCVVTKPSKD